MTRKPKGSADAPKRKGRRRSTRPPTETSKLTAQQQCFAAEYVLDWNATQAAIRAGYSAKNAASLGYQLLQKTPVLEAIEKAKAKLLEDAGIRAETVLLEIAKLAFASTRDILMVDESGNVVMRPGSEIPSNALDAVSLISASDTETKRDNGKGGISSTRTRTVSLKLHDKRAALGDLARYLRLMPDQLEVTGKNGGPVQTENVNAIPEDQRADRLASLLAAAAARKGHADR